MVKMKQKITRADGIEYERKKKATNYDCSITIKFKKDSLDKLKELAKIKNTQYSNIIRELVDQYIEYLDKKGEQNVI